MNDCTPEGCQHKRWVARNECWRFCEKSAVILILILLSDPFRVEHIAQYLVRGYRSAQPPANVCDPSSGSKLSPFASASRYPRAPNKTNEIGCHGDRIAKVIPARRDLQRHRGRHAGRACFTPLDHFRSLLITCSTRTSSTFPAFSSLLITGLPLDH
jgi:hypothetical protein